VRSPIGALADEHGIEVLTPQRAGAPDFLARLADIAPDCCPVVAYGALLPQSALDIPKYGWVNLHFSLLPAWRGAAPVQAAVRNGDEITGATTFQIVRELDAGPVFGVLTEAVRARDTAGELLSRLSEAGAGLLLSTMDGIEDGALRAVDQSADGRSYAGKVSVEDARVDFTAPAMAVDRLVRAVTPEPGAWAEFRGTRVKLGPVEIDSIHIGSAEITQDGDSLLPGELRVERKQVLVGTATGPVRLGDIQAQGKKSMAATDWARGTRIEAGERFS
jgi:methionyl-tRNA formyltransferase